MRRVWRRLAANRPALAGALITAVFAMVGLAAPYLAPGDPYGQDLERSLEGPTWAHPLGRDELGRDLAARLVLGTRVSLQVGLVVTSVSALAGVLLGAWAGYRGGLADELLMRLVDVLLAFPGLLLAISLVAILGPGLENVMLALCLMGWVGYARLARGQALLLRELEYMEAARALGAGTGRLVTRHVIPNLLAPVLVQATLGMAGAVTAEAGLSFLGLGVQPPAPSWGGALSSGLEFLIDAPHLTIFPGLAIALVVLGLNLAGDGLRDALDPRG